MGHVTSRQPGILSGALFIFAFSRIFLTSGVVTDRRWCSGVDFKAELSWAAVFVPGQRAFSPPVIPKRCPVFLPGTAGVAETNRAELSKAVTLQLLSHTCPLTCCVSFGYVRLFSGFEHFSLEVPWPYWTSNSTAQHIILAISCVTDTRAETLRM